MRSWYRSSTEETGAKELKKEVIVEGVDFKLMPFTMSMAVGGGERTL